MQKTKYIKNKEKEKQIYTTVARKRKGIVAGKRKKRKREKK